MLHLHQRLEVDSIRPFVFCSSVFFDNDAYTYASLKTCRSKHSQNIHKSQYSISTICINRAYTCLPITYTAAPDGFPANHLRWECMLLLGAGRSLDLGTSHDLPSGGPTLLNRAWSWLGCCSCSTRLRHHLNVGHVPVARPAGAVRRSGARAAAYTEKAVARVCRLWGRF